MSQRRELKYCHYHAWHACLAAACLPGFGPGARAVRTLYVFCMPSFGNGIDNAHVRQSRSSLTDRFMSGCGAPERCTCAVFAATSCRVLQYAINSLIASSSSPVAWDRAASPLTTLPLACLLHPRLLTEALSHLRRTSRLRHSVSSALRAHYARPYETEEVSIVRSKYRMVRVWTGTRLTGDGDASLGVATPEAVLAYRTRNDAPRSAGSVHY